MALVNPLSRGEKRLLGWSSAICALLLGAGALYERNNRVPDLRIPQAPLPAPNAYDSYQTATRLFVPPKVTVKGTAVDRQFDSWGDQPALYSAAYRARFPLARQHAFLRLNAPALAAVRAGLSLPYLQPPEREGKQVVQDGRYRTLARLLLVEAHARGQSGDWDGAAQSLLDVYRLGTQTARGGALIAALSGSQIRAMAQNELEIVTPHLSAAQARAAARRIEALQDDGVWARALEEEKRAMQSAMLALIRGRDWRPVYLSYPCLSATGCPVSPQQYERDLNALPLSLKLRLAWMDKPSLLQEYTRCLNWQIAQAQKPYPLRSRQWPFPQRTNDAVQQIIYPRYPVSRKDLALQATRDRFLMTTLALHAYRLEHQSWPRTLAQLAPRYLARVPLDPFGNRQTLLYAPVAVRYVNGFTIAPGPSRNPAAPDAVSLRSYASKPFKLWSRGLNARDDGGVPCENSNTEGDALRLYRIRPGDATSSSCDIVAGINR